MASQTDGLWTNAQSIFGNAKAGAVRRATETVFEFGTGTFGLTRKAGRAILQMTNAILRSRSARPGCFHDGKGRPECGLYIQLGGIQQDSIRGRF
jgi:hypothetical protein